MQDADLVFEQSHAQSAEHALKDDGDYGDHSEHFYPAARLRSPEPGGENEREEADSGGDKSMSVLEENAADPFRRGKKEHVVAEGGRPVWDGESGVLARDHSATADEEQGAGSGKPGEAVEPRSLRHDEC